MSEQPPSAPNTPTSLTNRPELSVVLAAFNEANRIEKIVSHWEQTVRSLADDFEIVVINDGSTDGTGRILDRLRKESKTLRVIHQLQMGLGASTRRGIEFSRGKFVFVGDCREPIAEEDAAVLWKLRHDHLVVLGYRPEWEARGVRRFFGQALFFWARLLFGSRLRDPNTPFRLLHREAAVSYLRFIPTYFQSINLLLALLIERDHREHVVEQTLNASGIRGLEGSTSLRTYFGFVAGSFLELTRLRLRHPNTLSGTPRTPASVRA